MPTWFEILGLTEYAYLATAFVIALATAFIPRRFTVPTLVVGSATLLTGFSVLVYLLRSNDAFANNLEQAALYFGRIAVCGGSVLAGVLARHSFAAFFSRLGSLSKAAPTQRRAPDDPPPKNDLIEGVAFACLLSVLCGLILVGRPMKPAILYWLAYAIACGVSISLPARARPLTAEGFKNVLVVSLPPSVVLFVILIFQVLAPLLWHIGILSVPSFTVAESAAWQRSSAWVFFWFYLAIGLATVAAIAIAVFARVRVVSLISQLFALDPERFSRVEKIVNSLIRIGAAIGGIFIVTKST
jgi:hypothetical protein